MSSLFQKDRHGVYRCTPFLKYDWLEHGFGNRHSAEWLRQNPAFTLRQIHSAKVIQAERFPDGDCEGDALVTAQIGHRIGVRTADCVPLLIVDPVHRAVAAVHAGWRGTVEEIARHAVEELQRFYESSPANLEVAIGPCIRACCYEVGPEVALRFASLFPEWDQPGTRRHIDLVEANRRVLLSAGISADHIFDSGLCTFCHAEEFFSYRRDSKNPGRHISSICRLR